MISGLNEKELDIANQIADLLLEKEKLQQENKQLKEQLEILLEDNNQLEEIRIKAIEKITDDRYSPIERLMLIKAILGDKENE